ncbi:hypothetical protein AVEN_265529-1 [Araneus ventricosus]|uniref:Uncharacterized protein n=1 Tax=Araneus ventricosus TaxID=182803 RepID=A0A4Y2VES7_ARAVE|nr:hypothetical protein AVEN_265529-1 [Araneus ventricosus]
MVVLGGQPSTQADVPALPKGEAMDKDAKSGQNRKPDRVRIRTKKVSKSRSEGTINTLLLDRSSSESDHTVIVSDTQSEVTAAEGSSDREIPLTPALPLSVTCGPESITPTDPF